MEGEFPGSGPRLSPLTCGWGAVGKGARDDARGRPRTSADEADGAEQPGLSVVHLQGQELPRKGEDEVCKGPKAGVVHLGTVQGQPVRERHGVLLRGVPRTDPQHLDVGMGKDGG